MPDLICDEQPKALEWLKSRHLDDEEQCILRRIIQREGPSRAFINGTPTTLSELKTFSQMLLDVHSQHEHQLLLKKNHQINLLDKYAELEEQKESSSLVFEKLQKTKAELNVSKTIGLRLSKRTATKIPVRRTRNIRTKTWRDRETRIHA